MLYLAESGGSSSGRRLKVFSARKAPERETFP